jgi:hypothetical protein
MAAGDPAAAVLLGTARLFYERHILSSQEVCTNREIVSARNTMRDERRPKDR